MPKIVVTIMKDDLVRCEHSGLQQLVREKLKEGRIDINKDFEYITDIEGNVTYYQGEDDA